MNSSFGPFTNTLLAAPFLYHRPQYNGPHYFIRTPGTLPSQKSQNVPYRTPKNPEQLQYTLSNHNITTTTTTQPTRPPSKLMMPRQPKHNLVPGSDVTYSHQPSHSLQREPHPSPLPGNQGSNTISLTSSYDSYVTSSHSDSHNSMLYRHTSSHTHDNNTPIYSAPQPKGVNSQCFTYRKEPVDNGNNTLPLAVPNLNSQYASYHNHSGYSEQGDMSHHATGFHSSPSNHRNSSSPTVKTEPQFGGRSPEPIPFSPHSSGSGHTDIVSPGTPDDEQPFSVFGRVIITERIDYEEGESLDEQPLSADSDSSAVVINPDNDPERDTTSKDVHSPTNDSTPDDNTNSSTTTNGLFLPPCRICGAKASGFHYGVNSCEACKGFFRRALKRPMVFFCTKNNSCNVNGNKRSSCRFCRYKRCLNLGMSKDAIKTGRYSHQKRTKDIIEVKRLQNSSKIDADFVELDEILDKLLTSHESHIISTARAPDSYLYKKQKEYHNAFLMHEKLANSKADRRLENSKSEHQASKSSDDLHTHTLISTQTAHANGDNAPSLKTSTIHIGYQDTDSYNSAETASSPASSADSGFTEDAEHRDHHENNCVASKNKLRRIFKALTSKKSRCGVKWLKTADGSFSEDVVQDGDHKTDDRCESPYNSSIGSKRKMSSSDEEEMERVSPRSGVNDVTNRDGNSFDNRLSTKAVVSLERIDSFLHRDRDTIDSSNCSSRFQEADDDNVTTPTSHNVSEHSSSDVHDSDNKYNDMSKHDNSDRHQEDSRLSPVGHHVQNDVRQKTKSPESNSLQNTDSAGKWLTGYISFAKSIPGFESLPAQDQAAALRHAWDEVWILGSYRGFNSQLGVAVMPSGRCFQLKEMEQEWGEQYARLSFDVADILKMSSLSHEMLVLLKAICIMSPGRCDIEDRKKLEDTHWLLVRCLINHLDSAVSKEVMTFAKLVSILTSLRNLSELAQMNLSQDILGQGSGVMGQNVMSQSVMPF